MTEADEQRSDARPLSDDEVDAIWRRISPRRRFARRTAAISMAIVAVAVVATGVVAARSQHVWSTASHLTESPEISVVVDTTSYDADGPVLENLDMLIDASDAVVVGELDLPTTNPDDWSFIVERVLAGTRPDHGIRIESYMAGSAEETVPVIARHQRVVLFLVAGGDGTARIAGLSSEGVLLVDGDTLVAWNADSGWPEMATYASPANAGGTERIDTIDALAEHLATVPIGCELISRDDDPACDERDVAWRDAVQ